MSSKHRIESETRFLWRMIGQLLWLPITLLLVLVGKRRLGDLTKSLVYFWRFLTAAKFTSGIIFLNIVAFVVSRFLNESTIIALISYPADLMHLRWYTLLTSGFLHADMIHLVGNMIAIFIFGRIVERELGPYKTAMIYFGSLLLAGVFSSGIHLFILQDNIGGLGASGALMGLISAAILLDPWYVTHQLIVPLPVMIVGWFTVYLDITGILNPVEDGIGHFAHLGGFISIAMLAFLLKVEDRKKLKQGLLINILSVIIAGLVYAKLFL